MKTKRSKNNPVNCFCRWESLPKNTSRRRSMICLLNMKGHGCCAPFLLADPSLWLRYPSAHLLTTKQFTGLFCLTSKALLGFKSLPITKNNLHTIRYVGCFGADEGTWTPTSKTLDPKSSASANSATSALILNYFKSFAFATSASDFNIITPKSLFVNTFFVVFIAIKRQIQSGICRFVL